KVISRAAGSSALASAAYRSASRLHDDRLDRHHDFSNKSGVVHSEVMLPDGAPEHLSNREKLWNEVEAVEKRIDAQLAREIEFAIPREMSQEQGIELARDFAREEFVDRGMIADLNVHWDIGADGLAKPHAHVMLTMREVGENGFCNKNRDWNRTDLLKKWRERWSEHVNRRLAELDIDARVDHRSLEAQGINLEPQHKIGPAASRIAEQGLASERLEEHHAIARSNGDKLLAHPALALDAITRNQATFTTRDLAVLVHRHSDGKDQFDRVMAAVKACPELVALGKDGRGEQRFTSRDMIETEARLEGAADRLAGRDGHGLPAAMQRGLSTAAGSGGLRLGAEQQAALEHITQPGDLAIVTGYAGTGKSAMLGIARDEWERAGYRVQGLALSGIAAENLESGSGIASRTIASIEHQWGQGRELLDQSSILVIDEAGMIGTRQLERVLSEAEKRGAKVVLVGDPEQLQAIEAGAAFRSTAERHGCVEITEVRRQHEDWQRDATRQLATSRTAEAIRAYDEHEMVHETATREDAREDLVDNWDRDRRSNPNASRIILTHTRIEVKALNDAARERVRESGLLGNEVAIDTERGPRDFASGDRVMFLKNERELGVKNGTLGTIETVSSVRMAVQLDDGRSVAFDVKDYNQIDHGYAATIHKAQGMTVDRTFVLATPGMDSHSAYVALSRHRDGVDLHYGRDDFGSQRNLVRRLSRERGKDMASDYADRDSGERAFAERRGITFRERVAEAVRKIMPEPVRSMFDGLRLNVATPEPQAPRPEPKVERHQESPAALRDRIIARHARAVQAIFEMQDRGGSATAEQISELKAARADINAIREHAAVDAENAYKRDRSLAPEAASGDSRRAREQIAVEKEVRTDPVKRADRFIERWNRLNDHMERAYADGDLPTEKAMRGHMAEMAKSLERDAQLESILANRKLELGIVFDSGRRLGAELAYNYGIDLGRGRGIGI
ncbi:Ti-type conjugative transfer relaxase TraA, partial [Sphingomonas pruni]|uniref:Ti-type conjugative transfer relaxase TraA n=1 Tax=Sphingomonas pruni TaxID=40683 RepID=UPI000AFF3E14